MSPISGAAPMRLVVRAKTTRRRRRCATPRIRADAARREGDDERAAALLRDAASRFRGQPYEGLDCDDLRADARRLDELRLTVLESMFQAELGAGRHHEIVGELSAFVA